MSTLYYHHADFLSHDTGPGHPECAERLRSIEKVLQVSQFDGLIRVCPEVKKDIKDKIALIHSKSHIESVYRASPEQGLHWIDGDTVISPGSCRAALLAVQAVCDAVDQLMHEGADNAFCAVRPPGHHAEPDRAMGFCLFNNIAIAAEYARKKYQIPRLAIIDFDVHHGNGTQAAFAQQDAVLYISSHEMPNYPGTGSPAEQGVGNILNLPLKPGSTGKDFRTLYEQIVFPALHKFSPDLIFISAGFDAHRTDPLSSIMLEEEDYRWLTSELVKIAARYCSGRLVSALEGGYNLQALGPCVAAHVAALMNQSG